MSKQRSYDLSWMPLHVADWRASDTVRVLSLAGKGAYLELLMSQWRAEDDGLSPDESDLRRIVGWTGKGWDAVWQLLAPHFPIGPDGKRRNPRVEAERAKILGHRMQQSNAGKQSAAGKRSRSSLGSVPGVAMQASGEREYVSAYTATEVVNGRSTSDQRAINNPNPNPNSTASDEAVRASSSAAAAGMAEQFDEPAHREAYLDFRRTHPNARGFDATLGMMLNGPGGPGGRSVTLWQLGSALADAVGAGVTVFNPQHFRGFLAKAPRERSSAQTIALVRDDLSGTIRTADGDVVWHPGMPIDRPTDDDIAANGWSVAA